MKHRTPDLAPDERPVACETVVENVAAEAFGGWADAEALRKWSFARRTPQQRLDWLGEAPTIAYQSGALEPDNPLK